MMGALLPIVHYALLLLYGILLSAAFAGIEATRRNAIVLGGLFSICGIVQLAALFTFGEAFVWYAYPLLGHLPIAVLLCLRYHKRALTALAAVATAYMCCQPANWVGILAETLTNSTIAEQIAQIITLIAVGYAVLRYAASSLAAVYNKDDRSVLVFSGVPFVYYLFDYSMSIYSEAWANYTGPVAEFLPCFLCLAFVVFCVTYHQAYEQKTESERREQIVRIAVEQQTREVEAMRRSENEVRMLRHDMRLLLSNLMQCLKVEDVASAKKMLLRYLDEVDKTVVRRFCENDIVNYVVSDYCSRCEKASVSFKPIVEMKMIEIDEPLFASLLSNALDNALNAQRELPAEDRQIKMALKASNGRLLLSVANPCSSLPTFIDGMPVSCRAGHGYGTQSIRYMSERLGGTCQFTIDGDQFVLRVAIGL